MNTNPTAYRVPGTVAPGRKPARGISNGLRTRRLAPWILGVSLAIPATELGAQNVSVTDYSVPVSRADNLRINAFSLNYVTEGDTAVVQSGNLGVIYKKFYDSLPFAYAVDLFGSTSINKDNRRDEWVGDLTADVDVVVKKYTPTESNVFVFAEPNLRYENRFGLLPDTVLIRLDTINVGTDAVMVQPDTTIVSQARTDRPNMNVTLGIGYGRFINATALRKAVRIEEFFLEEGIISEHLPKETMIRLGHIIEKEQEYRDLYGDRYENYWFEDMTNEISKSGLVLGEIAFGVLRMQEVLTQEQINDRFYGWEVNAGVLFQVMTPVIGRDRNEPALSIGFRYSRPISWNTQINTRFILTTPFSRNFGKAYDFVQTTDFIYEFANRISFTVDQTFRVEKYRAMQDPLRAEGFTVARVVEESPSRGRSGTTHSTVISLGLTFFIENKINLTASERITAIRGQPLRQSFNVGLSYKIF